MISNASDQKITIAYILGSGHSGSTMTDLILGSHPHVESLGEYKELPNFYRNKDKLCICQQPRIHCPIWGSVFKYAEDNGLQITPNKNEFLLLQKIQTLTKASILVDSSKDLNRLKKLLSSNLFSVKIIHLIRDGRAVAFSQDRFGRSFEERIKLWKKENKTIMQFKKQNKNKLSENWLTVRYEDIVTNPPLEVFRIMKFLGETFVSTQLNWTAVPHHLVGGSKSLIGGDKIKRQSEPSKIIPDTRYLESISKTRWENSTKYLEEFLKLFSYPLKREDMRSQLEQRFFDCNESTQYSKLDSLGKIDVSSSSKVELQKSSLKLQEIRQELKHFNTDTKSTDKIGSSFPLAAIVCGYEQGGTTLLTELLRQHPKLDSGFEGGFLLGEKPLDFIGMEPYYSTLKARWELNDTEVKYICQAENWSEVYTRLLSKARIIKNKNVFLFDKTPKYMQVLSEVLRKVPEVPCIVIVRDPRSVLCSWAKRKRSGWIQKNIERACNRYNSYAQGWKTAIDNGYKHQILLVQYEELCQNPIQEAEKIFNFIGLDFDNSYVNFTPSKKLYEGKVSNKYIIEYKKHFSNEICETILKRTKESREWFRTYF